MSTETGDELVLEDDLSARLRKELAEATTEAQRIEIAEKICRVQRTRDRDDQLWRNKDAIKLAEQQKSAMDLICSVAGGSPWRPPEWATPWRERAKKAETEVCLLRDAEMALQATIVSAHRELTENVPELALATLHSAIGNGGRDEDWGRFAAVLDRLRDAAGDMDRDELTELREAAAGLVEAIEKQQGDEGQVTRHEG
jgi:hypothetical protein